jgi:4,5-DOPA dioxygenase extradiol
MSSMREPPRNNNQMMPALFVGHGSPMNVVETNKFTKSLTELGRSLPKPKAIMVVSAHWLTEGTYVTCMEGPKTIYDFYGFPEKLYRIKYQVQAHPATLRRS